MEPDEDGLLRSEVLPGLWLDVGRFWQGDLAGVLAVLREALTSAEHKAFAEELN